MSDAELRGQALRDLLNKYTEAYDQGHPEISDKEWDDLYFKLAAEEANGDSATADSPTQSIHYDFVTALQKVEHNHKMLSLDKTKNLSDVKSFLNNQSYLAMAKMDGLTCSLRYLNGKLISAETRGNGIVGEDVTHNAKIISSIPQTISYTDELIVDGEIICTYKDFESFSNEYRNPRNFAAGSIRLLDASECSKRKLTFVAWDVIKGFDDKTMLSSKLWNLFDLGFTVVPSVNSLKPDDLDDDVKFILSAAKEYSYPIDGVVFKFNDVAYGKSLGETAHHFKNAIAYKLYDEEYETTLRGIEWTMGRTGVLTPVAIYDDIEIDGTICNRASLHNISIMQQTLGLVPYKGEKIWVIKSNMIIPQIVRSEINEDNRINDEDILGIIYKCPICGQPTEVRISDNFVKELYCSNEACDGKLINKLDHFASKKGLDIKGLSKATLEKLIDLGWVSSAVDLFNLASHRSEWINLSGFGEKSVDNILQSIENSKNCSLDSFIAALGIPLIGKTVAKDLIKHFDTYLEFKELIDMRYDFTTIDGFGPAMCDALLNFDYTEADKLSEILTITKNEIVINTNNSLAGKTIVITGKLHNYKNRAELQTVIEARGGKVASSVSKATTCLINNDNTSQSAKNLGAKKLGIPILTEDEFIFTYLTN